MPPVPPPAAATATPTWSTVHYTRVVKPRRMPAWLSAAAAMLVVAAVLAAIYFLVPKTRGTAAAVPALPKAEPTPAPSGVSGLSNTVELTGFRINEDRNQRVQIKFLVVNHSAAELPETKLQVSLKRDREEIMSFPLTLPSLAPQESREITATTKTRLRTYELPDWQFIRAEIRDVPETQRR
ncbi:MAG TPA: hypothetical protein VFL57_10005 [Bryobacteraceae bacterium]|nr:hypothetical protein [Bryobacteraceae bacterium]